MTGLPDRDGVEARYTAALNARPSKGLTIGSAGYLALTDAVADIPVLLTELDRLATYAAALEQRLSEADGTDSRAAEVLVNLRTWPVRQAARLAVSQQVEIGYDHRRYSHRLADAAIDAALAAAHPPEGT